MILELHFGVPWHWIRGDTRNRCCSDVVWMIHETAGILFPNEEFEVFFYPPEKGSYKDILQIIKKNPLGSMGMVLTLSTVVFQWLTYEDSHDDHLRNERTKIVDDTAKCLDLRTKLEELKWKWFEVENLPEDKLMAACGNLKLKKLKNEHWKTLQEDEMVSDNEITLSDGDWRTVANDKVPRTDFGKKIESVVENEEYFRDGLVWVIELISPVFKQKQAGKWTPWKGIYYWEDLNERWVEILRDWEEIAFFMQDSDFKKQIEEWAVSFQAGDNLKVIFSIKGSLSVDPLLFQGRSIYVTMVQKFNEDLVEHKQQLKRKNSLRLIAESRQTTLDSLINE